MAAVRRTVRISEVKELRDEVPGRVTPGAGEATTSVTGVACAVTRASAGVSSDGGERGAGGRGRRAAAAALGLRAFREVALSLGHLTRCALRVAG